jgi:hypothetical protein
MAECDELQELELRLAAAGPRDEAQLIDAAARVLLREAADRARLRSFRDADAFADGAMLVYRAALPDSGFQFGLGPRLAARPRTATALAWQLGDTCAMPYRAATPALALLRATVNETARLREANAMAACPTCRGLGWYITADNRKQMCRHGRGSA